MNRGSIVAKKNHLFGQTSCVKKIMYFVVICRCHDLQLSREKRKAEPYAQPLIFRKSPHFDSEIQNTLDCKKVVAVVVFFFSKSVFRGERRRREILARNGRVFFRSLLAVSFSAFTLAPGLSFGLLDRSRPLHKYGLFCSLRNTPK